MPEYGVRTSDLTELKLAHFATFIDRQQAVVQHIQRKAAREHQAVPPCPEYVDIDLTAGSGLVTLPDGRIVEGSPLIALRTARERGLPIRMWCCEIDPRTADVLVANLSAQGYADDWVRVVRGDHAATAPRIGVELGRLRGGVFGVIFLDPNGSPITRSVPAIRSILAGPRTCRLDVLIHVAATNQKRVAGTYDAPRLLDDVAAIGKRFCLIREPYGHPEWTYLILTNYPDFPTLRPLGFHDLRSESGQEIARRCNLSKVQRRAQDQLALPFRPTEPTPSTSVIPASVPSAPSSLNVRAVDASDVDGDRHATPITSATHHGGDSMFPTISWPSAGNATPTSTASRNEAGDDRWTR